ncbi:MAG: hypothetical protein RTU92_05125, partial [Candidatus Thorarchaeota archaeon]
MDGISNIQRAAATGLSAIGDSTPLVTTSDDGIYSWNNGTAANGIPIVTAQEFAQGRLVVSADYVSLRNNYDSDGDGTYNLYQADNELFWLNVLSWLGENRAPDIHVDSPNGGETLTGEHLISWSAVDGNGDPMTFDVLYSDDDGTGWDVLAVGITSMSLLWNTSEYADGDEYLIAVNAADYEISNRDESDAVFIVDNHGPTISGVIHDAEATTIEASVTDISGVDTVFIEYSLDNGTWVEAEMTFVSGDTYSITLGPFIADTDVQYRLRTNDTLGHWSDYTPIDSFTHTFIPTTTEPTTEPTTGPTTEPTTEPTTTPPPGDNTTLLIIIIAAGAVVIIIIIIIVVKKKK